MNASPYAMGEREFTDSKKTAGEVIINFGTYLLYLPQAVFKDY